MRGQHLPDRGHAADAQKAGTNRSILRQIEWGRGKEESTVFLDQTRMELERKARLLGYEPDREDTDADLILAIRIRGGHE